MTAPAAMITSSARAFAVRGFSLVELMVSIAILAILATIAIPAFNDASLNGKLSSISNGFVSGVQLARSEAIKRNATVVLCASSDGKSCGTNWSSGWVILAEGAPIHTQKAAPNGFNVSGTATSITFQPTGVGATPTTLTVCRSSPSPGSQKRTITLSASGRPSVAKVTGATSCP